MKSYRMENSWLIAWTKYKKISFVGVQYFFIFFKIIYAINMLAPSMR